MRMFTFLAAATAVGGLAAPLSAQSSYPYQSYPVQQTYPYQQQVPQYQQQVPQPYPGQPAYGYGQNPVGQIIDQLLGNRYNMNERQAVSRCATAAMSQAAAQYGNAYNRGYGSYGYANNGYNRGYSGAMRVTSITDVQRRNYGLRVRGLMSSGYGGQYGDRYGYQNRGYAQGELSFRCNVAYNGEVTNVRIDRSNRYGG